VALTLPSEGDPGAIFAFAMTFNGFEHYGSFETCADAARRQDRDTLEALRNELFFSARASRHRGDEQYVETYREILPLLRQHLTPSG
jgi:hypothetical protein